MIEKLLRKGYGVEDIALETGRSVKLVRDVVAILREIGELEELYRRK